MNRYIDPLIVVLGVSLSLLGLFFSTGFGIGVAKSIGFTGDKAAVVGFVSGAVVWIAMVFYLMYRAVKRDTDPDGELAERRKAKAEAEAKERAQLVASALERQGQIITDVVAMNLNGIQEQIDELGDHIESKVEEMRKKWSSLDEYLEKQKQIDHGQESEFTSEDVTPHVRVRPSPPITRGDDWGMWSWLRKF